MKQHVLNKRKLDWKNTPWNKSKLCFWLILALTTGTFLSESELLEVKKKKNLQETADRLSDSLDA